MSREQSVDVNEREVIEPARAYILVPVIAVGLVLALAGLMYALGLGIQEYAGWLAIGESIETPADVFAHGMGYTLLVAQIPLWVGLAWSEFRGDARGN